MNFALGVGYIVIGIVSIIVAMLTIWLLTKLLKKLLSKLPRINISKKLKSIWKDFFMILFLIIVLSITVTSVSMFAYEIGKFIIGLL